MNQCADNQISPEELELARDRLRRNPHIRQLLGKWIAPGFNCPILGQNILLDLLSDSPWYEGDDTTERQIDELERTLKDGKANCNNFRDIFEEGPPEDALEANRRILDMLTEVEAYRWLDKSGFREISKLRAGRTSVLDFTAQLGGRTHGVEATRLGRPRSDRKLVKPDFAQSFVTATGEQLASTEAYSIAPAAPEFQQALWDAVQNKHRQLVNFSKGIPGARTILVISTGSRFIYVRSLMNHLMATMPRSPRRAAAQVWGAIASMHMPIDGIVFLWGRRETAFPPTLATSAQHDV